MACVGVGDQGEAQQSAVKDHATAGWLERHGKAVALPGAFPVAGVARLFRSAYDLRLKGCTIHRAQARADVITRGSSSTPAS